MYPAFDCGLSQTAAGHDEVRRSGSIQNHALFALVAKRIIPIRVSTLVITPSAPHQLEFEAMVLMAIAYSQPITRSEVSKIFGREVSRDVISSLRGAGFVSSGPRSPTPGAPYTYVTTKHFLSAFGLETLRDLPDMEALEDAGLLSRRV